MSSVKLQLKKVSSVRRKRINEKFFKTEKGGYSYGDVFIGVRLPELRLIAKKNIDIDKKSLEKLIQSKIHEERLCGLLILVYRYKKGSLRDKKDTYKYYLKNIKYVNNWDIVDVTTPNIIGDYLLRNKRERVKIKKLIKSNNLWYRRIAILSNYPLIKSGNFSMFLNIAKPLLKDKEDLIHKALGWMLREVYKKDSKACEKFLKQNYKNLPRTTLRYAIERMPEGKRKKFLNGY